MTEASATAKYVRISPQKVRLVLDLVRGKSVPQAYSILNGTSKRSSSVVKKLLMTAADSAKTKSQTPAEQLMVSKITADGAGMFKRWRSMSMGRAGMIRKRLSHITVDLARIQVPKIGARQQTSVGEQKAQKPAKAVKREKSKKMAGVA